mgnify:CR=1 FL=1
MNKIEPPGVERLTAMEHPATPRAAIPIDLVIFAVRVLEFLTVLVAGIAALSFWSDRIFSGDTPVYGRSMLAGALIFALVRSDRGAFAEARAVVLRPEARDLSPLLGQVPLDTRLREGGDAGTPVVLSAPGSAAGSALNDIASGLAQRARGLSGRKLGISPV